MNSLLRDPTAVLDPHAEGRLSRADLLPWVNEALAEGFSEASRRRRPLLYVKERELECELPYDVIDSATEDVQFFRSGDSAVLGIGRAKEWEFDSEVSLRNMGRALNLGEISSCPSKTWLLGGWSFPPAKPIRGAKKGEEVWKSFPYSRWVVPALLFTSAKGKTRLTMAVYFESSSKGQREYYEKLVDNLMTSLRIKKSRNIPAHVRLSSLPSRRQWVSLARSALHAIAEGRLKKVVLSRSVRILFDGDVPCSNVLKRLVELNPDSTTFAIKIGDTTFLGATPEHLLSLKGREVEVDCLAASAPRSTDVTMDESLGLDLLADGKSRYEHQLVVQSVTKTLSAICSEITLAGEPLLKRLATVQHLYTVIRGRLLPEVSIWSTALSLWPTPATGGEPREQAVRWIRRHEPVSRGWYSGVVGCVSASGDGNLVVSIRSGVVRGSCAFTFAGSGIVTGSDPDAEFEETGWKMEAMMEALDVKGR